jgi:hypothetical protein
VQETSLEEEIAASSLGGAENYVKRLKEYAVSKGIDGPTYKFKHQKTDGKLYCFSFLKVSIEVAQNQALKHLIFTD